MTQMMTAVPTTRSAQATPPNRRPAGLSGVLAGIRPAIKVGLSLPLVLTLVMVGLAASASPASAYTESKSAYAGYVGLFPVQGLKSSPPPNVVGGVSPIIRMPAHVVGESDAYATRGQWVCRTTKLWAMGSTSWYVATSDYRCGWIRASDIGFIFSVVDFTGLNFNVGYSIDVTITWHLGDHTRIARSYMDYRHLGDYQCQVINCYTAKASFPGSFMWFG